MSSLRPRLSIIVPIGRSEMAWGTLLPQLLAITVPNEIILAASLEDARSDEEFQSAISAPIRICRSSQGRSTQMNLAATLSRGEMLWFIHADSVLTAQLLNRMNSGLEELERGLYYFSLKYQKDGPWLCAFNAWAANLRSQMFGLPFGDQGFLIARELFYELGGYPTHCSYGEDHLFVWRVHRAGLPVRSLSVPLYSSARKYAKGGWFRVTLHHLRLFLFQFVMECLKRHRL